MSYHAFFTNKICISRHQPSILFISETILLLIAEQMLSFSGTQISSFSSLCSRYQYTKSQCYHLKHNINVYICFRIFNIYRQSLPQKNAGVARNSPTVMKSISSTKQDMIAQNIFSIYWVFQLLQVDLYFDLKIKNFPKNIFKLNKLNNLSSSLIRFEF